MRRKKGEREGVREMGRDELHVHVHICVILVLIQKQPLCSRAHPLQHTPIPINAHVLHSSLPVLKLDSSFDYNLSGGRLLFRSGYLRVVCSIVPGCSCGS